MKSDIGQLISINTFLLSKHQATPLENLIGLRCSGILSGLWFQSVGVRACALVALVSWPVSLTAQQTDFDPEWFDCLELRRDGSFLVYWDRFVMEFACARNVCVNREQRTKDGRVAENFRHMYLEASRVRFTITTSVWPEDSETPESLTSRRRALVGCFTMQPDNELWTIDLGEARYEGDEIHSDNRVGDYRADYFYAPTRLLGDWSNVTMIEFEKASSGGRYMPAFFETSTATWCFGTARCAPPTRSRSTIPANGARSAFRLMTLAGGYKAAQPRSRMSWKTSRRFRFARSMRPDLVRPPLGMSSSGSPLLRSRFGADVFSCA